MRRVNPGRRLRFAIAVSLALIAVSLPVGALCATCCPGPGEQETLAERMPCCDEECAPKLVSGSPERPGPPVSTARPAAPAAAVLLATIPAHPLEPDRFAPPSIAGSRPSAARTTPLPLRL